MALSDSISLNEIENCPAKAYQAVHSVDDVLEALSDPRSYNG